MTPTDEYNFLCYQEKLVAQTWSFHLRKSFTTFSMRRGRAFGVLNFSWQVKKAPFDRRWVLIRCHLQVTHSFRRLSDKSACVYVLRSTTRVCRSCVGGDSNSFMEDRSLWFKLFKSRQTFLGEKKKDGCKKEKKMMDLLRKLMRRIEWKQHREPSGSVGN